MGKTKEEEGAMLVVDPPEELVLEGPFNRAVCKKILVFNPSKTDRVAFKLKTTTPKLFFVRPNVGMVMPEETVTIDIFVHPICSDQNVQRHKFLMQAAEANGNIGDLHEFWKTLPTPAIWDTKIKVKLIEVKKGAEFKSTLMLAEGAGMEGGQQEKDKDKDKENDPLAKLLQKVNELEEERQNLMQKVDALAKEKEQLTKLSLQQQQQRKGHKFLYFMIILVFAAAVGYFYNENYM
ncbi:vesicle-associated membrane protein-associated protein A [Drosophila innubila]|uniref:vesicle-associated membrane protein-associated protein A n=1 Tax=Drosophila innubila TaxID=198719 RepID=UPI00148BBFFD|nr:vesicle-associated membrane protein-associated protein A [Drosophila innubila]